MDLHPPFGQMERKVRNDLASCAVVRIEEAIEEKGLHPCAARPIRSSIHPQTVRIIERRSVWCGFHRRGGSAFPASPANAPGSRAPRATTRYHVVRPPDS